MRTKRDDPNYLFTLRYKLSPYGGKPGIATIHAWDGGFQGPNHTKIELKLRWTDADGSRVIFPRGATWCATPRSVDGIEAKELATATFAMKPGDTDDEYFASYTREQLEWCKAYGEDLDMLKQDRYCDPETGEVRL